MKIMNYPIKYVKCPSCGESESYRYSKEIKTWVLKHRRECSATMFNVEGFVEVIE